MAAPTQFSGLFTSSNVYGGGGNGSSPAMGWPGVAGASWAPGIRVPDLLGQSLPNSGQAPNTIPMGGMVPIWPIGSNMAQPPLGNWPVGINGGGSVGGPLGLTRPGMGGIAPNMESVGGSSGVGTCVTFGPSTLHAHNFASGLMPPAAVGP